VITVYKSKKILAMDDNYPDATHVAVRNGFIIGIGGADCAEGWGDYEIIEDFKNDVLMPGLIEAHAHVSAGGVWRFTYCGHYARVDPEGQEWSGVTTYNGLIERLKKVAAGIPAGQPVVGWGFDPSFLEGDRLNRHQLDTVSQDHPVVVLHSNFHVLSANSRALSDAKLLQGSNIEGVVMGSDGLAYGELQEFAAMAPVMEHTGVSFKDLSDADALRAYAKTAQNCGVTTVADLLSDLDDAEVEMLEEVTSDVGFPVRYVPMMNAMTTAPKVAAQRAISLRARSTDKLFLGGAKLFTDGAIQAFTAMVKEPGYYKGRDQGIWNMEVSHFKEAVKELNRAGVKTHIHTNGDRASELAIEAYEEALLECPNPDLRHTLEHVQLADKSQFRRMRALGLTVNVFANHLYYFGDVHWSTSIGPDRANRMDACKDAGAVFDGLFAIHSDAPVTPMAPLFTAWCAVTRQTQSGRILGNTQQISVKEALYAITMGAAYVLKMDDQLGSISIGKRADFVALEQDPMTVDPMALKDIKIKGTVLGGAVTT
jgi:predicted amidohydrolase YtcJ